MLEKYNIFITEKYAHRLNWFGFIYFLVCVLDLKDPLIHLRQERHEQNFLSTKKRKYILGGGFKWNSLLVTARKLLE